MGLTQCRKYGYLMCLHSMVRSIWYAVSVHGLASNKYRSQSGPTVQMCPVSDTSRRNGDRGCHIRPGSVGFFPTAASCYVSVSFSHAAICSVVHDCGRLFISIYCVALPRKQLSPRCSVALPVLSPPLGSIAPVARPFLPDFWCLLRCVAGALTYIRQAWAIISKFPSVVHSRWSEATRVSHQLEPGRACTVFWLLAYLT